MPPMLENARTGLIRLLEEHELYDIGIVSAWRADNSHEQNAALHQEASLDIRALKYDYVQLEGYYQENGQSSPKKEISFVIINKGYGDGSFENFRDDIIGLGKYLDQDSVILWLKQGDAIQYEQGREAKRFPNFSIFSDLEEAIAVGSGAASIMSGRPFVFTGSATDTLTGDIEESSRHNIATALRKRGKELFSRHHK